MYRAAMAALLVNYTDDEHHRIWSSFKVNWPGHATARSTRRQLYERTAKGESEIKEQYRTQHPSFGAAYDAIFGDPFDTPSYSRFRKFVAMGSHRVLADPVNWDRLPDSVEAIYQLSFIGQDDLAALVNSDSVYKRMSVSAAKQLRRDHPVLFGLTPEANEKSATT
jgi:hypothetical protein